jgi:hypothetical protein
MNWKLRNLVSRVASQLINKDAPLYVANGHFYSPINSLKEADAYVNRAAERTREQELPPIDDGAMLTLLERLARHFSAVELHAQPSQHQRYYVNPMYGPGDALLLASFIAEFKPRRIVEVGCGFSSACALDAADRLEGHRIDFTFIDPYPGDRLNALLRPSDRARVTVHEMAVQTVDLAIFDQLQNGDLLFLDTTHISKTGSDVNHELFAILPRLKSGVFIHFHDIFDRWEYPKGWIGRSWNELYILRAFLMYNTEFDIVFFNDHIFNTARHRCAELSPVLANGAGGGLYLRKR